MSHLQAIPRMALLLGRYDADSSHPASGSPRDQLDSLVDELLELILIFGLWDAT